MSRKSVLAMTLIFALIGILSVAFKVKKVEASGTIYIMADGSVFPSTANITSLNNVTYTFTGNINDEIVIERDNIVVDGANHTVQGTGTGNGISLSGRSNVTIKKMKIKAFAHGIDLVGSSNNNISGNTITNNLDGIVLYKSSNNNTVSGNNIAENQYDGISSSNCSNNNIYENNITNSEYGIWLDYSSNNKIYGNNITANNLYGVWLEYSSNNSIYGNTITNHVSGSGVVIYQSSNCSVSGNNVTKNESGICLEESSNCSISGNNATENQFNGIKLTNSSSNTITGNNVTENNSFGIRLEEQSHSNTISRNEVADNGNGIDLYSLDFFQENNIIFGNDIKNNAWGIHFLITSNCTITRNNVENNTEGIVIYRSRYTTITENNITSNTNHGIYLDMSYDGKVYHNNFIGNGPPFLYFSTNMWDNGYPSGGNYWSDYEERYPNATEIDGSGIWDTPYEIDENNTDYYPLMEIIPEFPTWKSMLAILIVLTVATAIYKRRLIKTPIR